MKYGFHKTLAVGLLALILSPNVAVSQEESSRPVDRTLPVFAVTRGLFSNELCVVGSDGTFYQVRQNWPPLELPAVGAAVVPPLPSSTLEAFDLNPDSKGPNDAISFSGIASQLGIGKDNRLYLVVTTFPEASIAEPASLVPVRSPKSKLYIVPTPFPPRILNVSLESLTGVVEIDFEGTAQALRVKEVGDQEYVYVSGAVVSYRFPTLTGGEGTAVPSVIPGPVQVTSKLLIFHSTGRKIKEVNSE